MANWLEVIDMHHGYQHIAVSSDCSLGSSLYRRLYTWSWAKNVKKSNSSALFGMRSNHIWCAMKSPNSRIVKMRFYTYLNNLISLHWNQIWKKIHSRLKTVIGSKNLIVWRTKLDVPAILESRFLVNIIVKFTFLMFMWFFKYETDFLALH